MARICAGMGNDRMLYGYELCSMTYGFVYMTMVVFSRWHTALSDIVRCAFRSLDLLAVVECETVFSV